MKNSELIKLFSQYKELVPERARLFGLLKDFYPEEKLKVNLLMMAYDAGIFSEIYTKSELTVLMYSRFVKILENDYGISTENASWSVNTWFSSYGRVCGKTWIEKEENNKERITKEAVVSPIIPKKGPVVFRKDCLNLSEYEENQKLPKSIIHRYPDIEKKFGISDITCTAMKESWYESWSDGIKIVGEIQGKRISSCKSVLIFLTVYNDAGELIGGEYGTKIWEDDFTGYLSFSETIVVPKDELISEIQVRAVLDPAFAD